MTAPLVSIGLPVYNGALTLERVLATLVRQTYSNVEIVISDNGSADRTAAIGTAFAERHANVRFERVAENRGAIWNFNRVLELSRGEFFLWAAHDDERDAHYVEHALARLLERPDAAVCHSQIRLVGADGDTIRVERTPIVADFSDARRRFARTLDPSSWQFAIYGLMRRAALDRTRGMRNYYGSDLGLVSELAIQGPILQLEAPLFRYRLRLDERLDHYLARVLPSLEPGNRYRPWVPLRPIAAREHLAGVLHAELDWREKLSMIADVIRWLAVGHGARDELLRLATAAIRPDRVERLRQRRRRNRGEHGRQ